MAKYTNRTREKMNRQRDQRKSRSDWRQHYVNNDLKPLPSEIARIEHNLEKSQVLLMKMPVMVDQMESTKIRNENNRTRTAQYMRMANRNMLMSCLQPMAENFSPLSVITSLSMITAAYMLNDRIHDSIKSGFSKLQERRYANALAEMKDNPGKFGNKHKMEKLYERWAHYAAATRDGRIPLSAETAASMKITLEKQRYDMVRDIKAKGYKGDILQQKLGEVEDKYHDSLEYLKDLTHADNVPWSDVQREERIIVDRLMRFESEGSYDYMFEGLAQGKVSKSDPTRQTFRYERNGKPVEETMDTWDGQYFYTENNLDYDGGFQSRPLYNVETLADDMAGVYTVSCADAKHFSETGDTRSLSDSQYMMYKSMNDFIRATNENANIAEMPLPAGLERDPSLRAMYDHYMDYFAMAQADSMTGDEVSKSVGLATAQGLTSWIAAEYVGEDYEAKHDDIVDVMQAKQFALASSHLDPNSPEWQDMAEAYFDKVYKTDKFEAENPADIKERWAEQKQRMEERIAEAKDKVAEDQKVYDGYKKDYDDANAHYNTEDDNHDNGKVFDPANSDGAPVRLEKLKEEVLEKRDKMDKQGGNLAKSIKELRDLEDELAKASEKYKKYIADAERVWADKPGHDAAVESNQQRKEYVEDMAKVFASGMRTAESFGATDKQAERALGRGVGATVRAWADGDDKNLEFANVVEYRAKRSLERFGKAMSGKHPEWFDYQRTESVQEHANNVATVVLNRYDDETPTENYDYEM